MSLITEADFVDLYFGDGRVEPAYAGALLAQGLAHGLEQMGLATAGLAPQVGGHGRAGGLAAALAGGQAQMLQGGFIGACIKPGQRGPCGQADVQCQLLHHGCRPQARRQRVGA